MNTPILTHFIEINSFFTQTTQISSSGIFPSLLFFFFLFSMYLTVRIVCFYNQYFFNSFFFCIHFKCFCIRYSTTLIHKTRAKKMKRKKNKKDELMYLFCSSFESEICSFHLFEKQLMQPMTIFSLFSISTRSLWFSFAVCFCIFTKLSNIMSWYLHRSHVKKTPNQHLL